MNIKKTITTFKTKHKEGFTSTELLELVSKFPDIDIEKFNQALDNVTAMIIDGELITYSCDVEIALSCGIEKRDININEFD